MTKNSRYLYINIYLFIYLFIRLFIGSRDSQIFNSHSIFTFSCIFVVFSYLFSYFRLFFFLFWLYYHYCYLFFRFLLTPQTAIGTPHPDPAFSEHPFEKASQRGRL